MTTAEEPPAVPMGSPLLSSDEQGGVVDTSVVGTGSPPQSGQQRVRQPFGLGGGALRQSPRNNCKLSWQLWPRVVKGPSLIPFRSSICSF